jgi:hypothetical protein
MTGLDDIGFHFVDDELTVNLNQVFFDELYETSDVVIAVDGYLVLEEDIGECLRQETLQRLHEMYKKHGIRCVEQIKTGKFNLLVHDKNREKLYVANDYFGSLPFYYTTCEPFEFSSNILNLPFREMDWYALSQYLTYGYFLWERTQDRYIRVLPPHAILEHDLQSHRTEIHGYMPKNVTRSSDVEALFRRACQRLYHDTLDYELGLSGGVDSRFLLYHWPDKEDLVAVTGHNEIMDEAQQADVAYARMLTGKVPVREHMVISHSLVDDVNGLRELFSNTNPFLVRKLHKPGTDRRRALRLNGSNAPIIGGKYLVLKHNLFMLTVLFGVQFPVVDKRVLHEGAQKVSADLMHEYLSDGAQARLTETPVPFDRVNIEDYHLFVRMRRRQIFTQPRQAEVLLPFMDYDFYFSCRERRDRVNNRLYYSILRKMPGPYREVPVTTFGFPLGAPRRLQHLSNVAKTVKKMMSSGASTIEEVGAAIRANPALLDYMTAEIQRAGLCDSCEELADRVDGGTHGYFFYLLFVTAYWMNNVMNEGRSREGVL